MSITSPHPSRQDEQGVDVTTPTPVQSPSSLAAPTVATMVAPLVAELFRETPDARFVFWDGSSLGPADAIGTVRMTSPEAIRRMLWMPDELGIARAYVAGDIEVDGDIYAVLDTLREAASSATINKARVARIAVPLARRLGVLKAPLAPPPEEARLGAWRLDGLRHSLGRDSKAISHHYDVGNDFFELVLGPTMTYSCARFTHDSCTLDDAQTAKYELICRKLGLHERPGMKLLDVGCGWGSMAIHAATHHGADVVGITISKEQAARARERAAAAGQSDRVEIRLQDYRELKGETFDAISSIGMSEHVGADHLATYFTTLRAALVPTGRLLNHAISSVGGSKISRSSFMGRYVFPDAELIDVGNTCLAMEKAGFEVRDVESLREHYAKTLRAWVANLDANWDRAVDLVGKRRARVWRLYMAGASLAFDDGRIAIHQVLGVVDTESGQSAMPLTRRSWD